MFLVAYILNKFNMSSLAEINAQIEEYEKK